MPFLQEHEWKGIEPLLYDSIKEIKEYRVEHRCDLKTALINVNPDAMKEFERITGMPNVPIAVIYHHRLTDWGPECDGCEHLLRTPNASFCVNCGKKKA